MMKKLIALLSALAMLLTTFACVSVPVLANDTGAVTEYTYVITSTVNYSHSDKKHNNEQYRIEILTNDPNHPGQYIKTQDSVDTHGNPIIPVCGASYKWTVITEYKVDAILFNIYYKDVLQKTYTIENPQENNTVETYYLFNDPEPEPEPEPQPVSDYQWKKSGNYWYYYYKNQLLKGWQRDNGVWYYLDKKDGHMLTGWRWDGGVWYYLSYGGSMQTGWQKIGGVWYYFNRSGAMQTGWQKINNVWYFLKSSGAMHTGWLFSGGKWYFLQSSGAMKCGWVYSGGKWYYMRNDGSMVANAYAVSGSKRYYFNASGACTNP